MISSMIRLGILGGGQLAQMMTQAAISLGIEIAIFERKPDSPASRLTHYHLAGDWSDQALLAKFASQCDLITLENEFVDAGVLQTLEQTYQLPVYPSSQTLARIQDKLIQKQTMAAVSVPVPAFSAVESRDDLDTFGYPALLKARREGYDGYGNAMLHTAEDVGAALQKLAGRDLLVERFVPFVRELAVMVLRGRDGEIKTYPVVETVQKNHVCHVVRAPAVIADSTRAQALQVAQQAVEAVDGVGVFGVELFELEDGSILYNEMAPRPHNSGHYTIEGCVTSQFENHIRAVMGWPLGSTELIAPAVVMVNLLGDRAGALNPNPIAGALRVPDAHIHLYSKREVRPGRKMGHITVLGDTIESAERRAWQAVEGVNL